MTDNDCEKLHYAASKGRVNSVKALLASGVDLHAMNDDGENALILATREAHPSMVRLLLELGARFVSKTRSNRGAFPLARLDENTTLMAQHLHSGSDPTWEPWSSIKKPSELRVQRTRKLLLKVTELLIAAGADINVPDEQGNTPLHNFITDNLDECVKLLLRYSPELNTVNEFGDTPLCNAIGWRQKYDIALLLLETGADPNSGDDYKPIHLVSGPYGSTTLLRKIIAAGADVNACTRLGRTALHCACDCRDDNSEIIGILLDSGADATLTDNEGFLAADYAMLAHLYRTKQEEGAVTGPARPPDSPVRFHTGHARLVLAAMRGDVKMLANSLNDGIPDTIKTLALHEAINSGSHACCRLLLDNGANPNGRDLHTYTPLLSAASMLDFTAAELLLEYGASLERGNSDGQKPLFMVCQAGTSCFDKVDSPKTKRLEMARLFLAHGADVDGADGNGFTPLRQAILAAQDIDLARLLLEHGAWPDREDHEGYSPLQHTVDLDSSGLRELLEKYAENPKR